MISPEEQEWNRKIWILNLIERKLDQNFQRGLIKKNKYKKNKKIISLAWIKIWDFHPDQHPLAKEFFKLNFS
jgi:hypothetical protein